MHCCRTPNPSAIDYMTTHGVINEESRVILVISLDSSSHESSLPTCSCPTLHMLSFEMKHTPQATHRHTGTQARKRSLETRGHKGSQSSRREMSDEARKVSTANPRYGSKCNARASLSSLCVCVCVSVCVCELDTLTD